MNQLNAIAAIERMLQEAAQIVDALKKELALETAVVPAPTKRPKGTITALVKGLLKPGISLTNKEIIAGVQAKDPGIHRDIILITASSLRSRGKISRHEDGRYYITEPQMTELQLANSKKDRRFVSALKMKIVEIFIKNNNTPLTTSEITEQVEPRHRTSINQTMRFYNGGCFEKIEIKNMRILYKLTDYGIKLWGEYLAIKGINPHQAQGSEPSLAASPEQTP